MGTIVYGIGGGQQGGVFLSVGTVATATNLDIVLTSGTQAEVSVIGDQTTGVLAVYLSDDSGTTFHQIGNATQMIMGNYAVAGSTVQGYNDYPKNFYIDSTNQLRINQTSGSDKVYCVHGHYVLIR